MGKIYYWEHLGRPDIKLYSENWQNRRNAYIKKGIYDNLITSDDLDGIDKDKLIQLIDDIKSDKIKDSPDSDLSSHHYQLY